MLKWRCSDDIMMVRRVTKMVDTESNHLYDEETEKIVDGLTLFDDDLMSLVFDENIPATELVLRIILGRAIKVISVEGQEEMKNPIIGGRNITLDVHAIDVDGQHIDIEVQGDSAGAHVRRARFHSSMMDARMLKENEKFKSLTDSYVIFIYKHDKFGKGLPLYHIDRYVRETEELFEDGSHIIYVNGKYKGDDEIGMLMEDFGSTKSSKIHFPELADGIKHFKETEEGRDIMCEKVKRYGDKKALQKSVENVLNLMETMKLTLEQALDALKITGKERTAIVGQLQK